METARPGLRSGGFGMLIVRQIVDEMVYNERGNEVLLIKHLTDVIRRPRQSRDRGARAPSFR